MDITWGYSGSYNITDRNMPDFPIGEQEMDGGNYVRKLQGSIYNPSRYKYKVYSFSFSAVTSGVLDQFAELFKDEPFFTITDSGFGTVVVIPVPGSLSTSYLTQGNCNLTFVVEERVAT